MKLTARQKRPDHINPWNALSDPTSGVRYRNNYIGWHKEMAEEELDALREKFGLLIHSTNVESDGWLDGFKCLHAIVETPSQRLLKIRWHDGNQAFMVHGGPGCGWGLIHEGDVQ